MKSRKRKPDNSIPKFLSELCRSCRKCCTDVGIHTPYKITDKDTLDFYKTRGFTVEVVGRDVMLVVSFPCPQLTDKGCKIYKKRPKVCREYSGYKSQDGCRFDELAERIQA